MDLEALPSTAEERARRCRDYVDALEEERRKIQVFQRELPLSVHLVTQTIESYRQQIAAELFAAGGVVLSQEQEEEEAEMLSEGAPVFEEFIPLKRSSSSEAEDDIEAGDRRQHNDEDINSNCQQQEQQERSEKKPDWLRSVQLWTQQPDPQHLPREEDDVDTPPRPIAVEAKRATGAFLPFHPQKKPSPSPSPAAVPVEVAPEGAPAAASSTSETRSGGAGGGGKSGCSGGDRKDGQPDRKVRRCWSQELHRRFLNALQQLGGSNVATPRRIRELMMVEGLTNDEVKSHLQKYRLHSRRPSSTSGGNAGNAPPQQVVFVGGIWVPPPEYEAAAEGIAAGPPRAIYAPIASVPAPKLQQQQMQQQQRSSSCRTGPSPPGDGRSCREEQTEATRSNSPATSSSSRTTTPSPPQC